MAVLLAVPALPQAAPAPEAMLGAALHQERVTGNLQEAIEGYRKLLATKGVPRSLAAQAQYHIGICHEKLGNQEARKAFENVVRNFPDQKDLATQARQRLAALDGGTKHTGGLTARQVATGPDVDIGSITLDGRLMAMTHWETGDVAIRDMAAGQIKRLNLKTSWNDSGDFAEWPVFSPDQRQIAYAWYSNKDGNYQVRLVAAETGAKPRTLVSNPELEYFQTAGWSRDGKSILAGIWRKDRTAQLAWISAGDGSVKVLKSLEWRSPQRIVLSPDGRHIAYDVLQKQDGPDRDIYVLAADGSSESALVEGPAHDAAPFWTPDGSRVVFLSNRSDPMDLWSIAVREGKPHGAPQFVMADIGNVEPIGFSRSGSFHYVQNRSDEDIFAVDMDPVTGKGRGPAVRITQTFVGQNQRAAWSPDRKWIAYHSRRGHSRYGPGAMSLVVRSVETGEEKVFPSNLQVVRSRPVWFHRGSAILEPAGDPQGKISFHKVDLGTGKFELLRATGARFRPGFSLASDDKTIYAPMRNEETKTAGVGRFDLSTGEQTWIYNAPDRGRVSGLSLSPNGRTLAIMLGERPRQQVAVVGIDGSGFRALTEQPNTLLGLAWSPDSRYVYFVRIKNPESEVWRVPAAGGTAEYTGVAAKGLGHIHLSTDGTKLAFTAGESVNAELWVLENVLPVLKASQ